METENVLNSRIHHGHNLTRLRREKGIKQTVMAQMVQMSQQHASRFEAMPVIDDENLKKFADALGVSVDMIKNMKEDIPTVFIENNNTFSTKDNNTADNIFLGNNEVEDSSTSTNHFNPAEMILRLSDEKAQLYERLIKTEQEKNEVLEKRLSALEQKLNIG